MTYGEAKRRVLQLINQYTVAGTEYASSYNNQQDYINRIPGLLDDAIREISLGAKKIPQEWWSSFNTPSYTFDGQRIYTMPEDFYQFITGEIGKYEPGRGMVRSNDYALMGRNRIAFPDDNVARFLVYYRYPAMLGEHPAEDAELDNDPEAQDAACFYAAAWLAKWDDEALFADLYNKYEDKLSRMDAGVTAQIQDALGGDADPGAGGNWGVYET